MQPEATGTSTGTSQPSAAPPAGGRPPGCAGDPALTMIIVMIPIFYFLILRPQQKQRRETEDFLKALKKGDKVRTSGGIRGEIVDLTDTEVNLLVADKVKINVLRSHIASRIGAGGEGGGDDAKSKAAG